LPLHGPSCTGGGYGQTPPHPLCTTGGDSKYGCKCSDPDPSQCAPIDMYGVVQQVFGVEPHPTLGEAPNGAIINFNGECIKIIGSDYTGTSNANGQWDGNTYPDCTECDSEMACDSLVGVGVSYLDSETCAIGGHITCGATSSFAIQNAPDPNVIDYSGKVLKMDYAGTSFCWSIDSGFGPNGLDAHVITSYSGECLGSFIGLYPSCADCFGDQNGETCP
jgi:hypothetical protein